MCSQDGSTEQEGSADPDYSQDFSDESWPPSYNETGYDMVESVGDGGWDSYVSNMSPGDMLSETYFFDSVYDTTTGQSPVQDTDSFVAFEEIPTHDHSFSNFLLPPCSISPLDTLLLPLPQLTSGDVHPGYEIPALEASQTAQVL